MKQLAFYGYHAAWLAAFVAAGWWLPWWLPPVLIAGASAVLQLAEVT